MKFYRALLMGILLAHPAMAQEARQLADAVISRFLAEPTIPVNYTNDVTLNAVLAMHDATGEAKYLESVQGVMERRGMPPGYVHPYRSQPFCSISLELLLRTQDERYKQPFLTESAKYREEAPRSFDGAVSHYGEPEMGRILIDQLQDYAYRMACTGRIGGDASYYREAVEQYRLFRSALRNPTTGLWGHARGWFDSPRSIVAVAWGRGQGWVLRGMVESLKCLPKDSPEARQMREWMRELAAALVRYQDREGMWHQVVDRPDSYPETSATGLIVYYFARAARQGYLPERPYAQAALRGFEALKSRIGPDGVVKGTCVGTPPQKTIEDYLAREQRDDDPHGRAAAVFACAGRILLERLRR